MEKMFHHEHHQKDGKQQEGQQEAQGKEPQKKESEMDKLKDYIKEDEKLEQEGGTYGGLMWPTEPGNSLFTCATSNMVWLPPIIDLEFVQSEALALC